MNALDTLGRQKTVLLQTRKRDGTWVGTAVSIVVRDGRVYFRTYDASGKAKRLRNFPDVKVAPSNWRGKATGPSVNGRARLLDDDEAAPVRELLAAKYPLLQRRMVPAMHKRKGWKTLHYELEII
jgi:PPOX class probable F420-dependent enzyme